jgi:hypothetical protein
VAGTAGAVHHHQEKKYAAQDAQQQQEYDDEQYEEEPYEEEQAPAAPGSDMTDQLKQLAQLHTDGVLTDEEFSAAKAKLLAS